MPRTIHVTMKPGYELGPFVLSMEEAKRILEWRALIHPKEEEKHWGPDDDALMSKLLDFVDD